jgi:hypothetical protein
MSNLIPTALNIVRGRPKAGHANAGDRRYQPPLRAGSGAVRQHRIGSGLEAPGRFSLSLLHYTVGGAAYCIALPYY